MFSETEAERNRRIEFEIADAAHMAAVTRPKNRPVKGWRADHKDWVVTPFQGRWEYEPGCGCAKCENWFHEMADCCGAYEF